jgi:host factor-I protein
MSKTKFNLQDSFLNQVRKGNIPISIFLTNGVRLKGSVKGFDNFTVLLLVTGKQHLIFKHAISTIIPSKQLKKLFVADEKEGDIDGFDDFASEDSDPEE